MRTLKSKIMTTMTKADERDLQKKVGPSDLSQACEVCLAAKLFNGEIDVVQSGGSLATWLGTALHEKLERDEQDDTITPERKVVIGELNLTYGMIKGTSDRYDAEFKAVVDYKGTTKVKLKKLLKGVLTHSDGRVSIIDPTLQQYYTQLCLYGLGVEEAGDEVKTVAIFFVPRDSTRFEDCEVMEFPYQRHVAEEALTRAQDIYDHVHANMVAGLDPLDGLESDPDCWNCQRTGYR